jgi:hypothetical protein
LDIGVLGYIGILYYKEHLPEVWHIPPGTPYYHTEPSKYNKKIYAVFMPTKEKRVGFCGMTWCISADGYYCFGGTCHFESSLNAEMNVPPLVTTYETTVSWSRKT